MDGIILVVSAAEKLSNKPLLQHMQAIKIGNFKNVIVLFNKLDLISKNEALRKIRYAT